MQKQLCPSTPFARLLDELASLCHESTSELAAQQAVAEKYAFTRWRHLELLLEDSKARLKSEVAFERLACLDYMSFGHNFDKAAAALNSSTQTNDNVSIWKACCVGDLETVKNLIDADPTIVNQSGGFFDWEPLMYACYSRLQ
ncbi:MAG: hypothetical protein AB8G99_21800, partial [Planctomycetaceae bacterium]